MWLLIGKFSNPNSLYENLTF